MNSAWLLSQVPPRGGELSTESVGFRFSGYSALSLRRIGTGRVYPSPRRTARWSPRLSVWYANRAYVAYGASGLLAIPLRLSRPALPRRRLAHRMLSTYPDSSHVSTYAAHILYQPSATHSARGRLDRAPVDRAADASL